MNTSTTSLLVAATLGVFASLPSVAAPDAAAKESVPFGFVIGSVSRPNNVEIARGATTLTVLRLLGSPHRELSPDVWAYHGFYPDVANERGCDTLIVTFAGDRVKDLRIVNKPAVTEIAANLKAAAAAARMARK